jgi:hypothetical protein
MSFSFIPLGGSGWLAPYPELCSIYRIRLMPKSLHPLSSHGSEISGISSRPLAASHESKKTWLRLHQSQGDSL